MSRRRWRDSAAVSAVVPGVVPGAVLVGWQVAASTGLLPSQILPAPAAVLKAGADLIADGELPHHLAVSSARALTGLCVGGSISFALGLLTGLSPFARRLLDPALQMVRTIPHLALLPLVILWFGIGEPAKILLVAWGIFFPIYLNTYHGVVSVDPQLVEMGRSYGMTRWTLFCRIIFPGALPSILIGLRFGLGIMWLTLIVAETIAASSGIGYMATQAREFSQTDVIVLAIFVYAALGKLADTATRLLERRLLAWNPTYAGAAA